MSSKPKIPNGGFLAVQGDPRFDSELEALAQTAGAAAVANPQPGILLAAWTEFPGQGLWRGQGGAVAYDLDLTNAAALRSSLEDSLAESSDPGELLWALYRQHGPGFVDALRGAFAFALWDASERRLLVATDPYGIRPVVYAEPKGSVVAASRIRHALLHPEVARDLDPQAVYQYLFFSAIPSPNTIYRSVRKLEPGRFLHSDGTRCEVRTYYDLRYRPDLEAGEAYWKRAIPLQLRRAVGHSAALSEPERTGCFLSGGTDSSSVVGYYGQVTGRPARTFSIGFDEPGYNELDFAHLAVERFGTEQHETFVTPGDVLSLVESLPGIYDEPFGNSSVVPAYYCAQMGRQAGVDVLLAGDGGDEIFGGNERYVTNLVFERYHSVPRWARRGVLEPLLRVLPGIGPVYKAQRYARRANLPNPERFFSYNLLAETAASEIFTPDFLSAVDTDSFLQIARQHYQSAAPAHVTDRLLYLDMKFTVTDNDLRKVTQMGEAAGVRIRYPLLDRDLVDFTGTIPPTLKVKPGRGRYIFKEALRGFLPDAIITKTKHGFGLPIAPWFRSDPALSQLLRDNLFSERARIRQWVRPEFLETMRRGFDDASTSYYGDNFWVFLMLEMWMEGREA